MAVGDGGVTAVPLASNTMVSLVLMTPSTLTRLKVASTARRSMPSATSGSSGASVVTTASIVASDGAIMPEPLHMPPMVAEPPSSSVTWTADSLLTRSVVMMASAASRPPLGSAAATSGAMPSR